MSKIVWRMLGLLWVRSECHHGNRHHSELMMLCDAGPFWSRWLHSDPPRQSYDLGNGLGNYIIVMVIVMVIVMLSCFRVVLVKLMLLISFWWKYHNDRLSLWLPWKWLWWSLLCWFMLGFTVMLGLFSITIVFISVNYNGWGWAAMKMIVLVGVVLLVVGIHGDYGDLYYSRFYFLSKHDRIWWWPQRILWYPWSGCNGLHDYCEGHCDFMLRWWCF